MAWTKETVLEKLRTDPRFNHLCKEMDGPFTICYKIGNNHVLVSNSVGGFAETFLMLPFDKDSLTETIEFAMIAKEVLQKTIQNL